MHTGRKILNLRCDRHLSQQDLAHACEITPSALSKIEAGINSPRANIIWKIARNLGVTVEYLLDENMPYPYPGHSYRQEFLSNEENPETTVRMEVSREEKAFLLALRESHEIAREIAFFIPTASVETIRLTHFLINHSRIKNPTQGFLKRFESLVTNGTETKREPATRETTSSRKPETRRGRSGAGASRSAAKHGVKKKPKKKVKAKKKRAAR